MDKKKYKSQTMDYEYKPFEESRESKLKNAELSQLQKPQQQAFTMQDQLQDTMNKIFSHQDFEYDVNADALYQQYKDNYTQQGKQAMKDAMGQASMMTGGYGNSYASAVGNQAYQASLQQLNNVVPELYQLAYNKHQGELAGLQNQYAMLSDREAIEKSDYQNQLADYYNQYQLMSSEADRLYNRDYNEWANSQSAMQSIAQADRDHQYLVGRDKVADSQWNKTYNYQVDRDEVADSQWDKTFKYTAGRDKVADSQWNKQFEHAMNMDYNDLELANKQYQLNLSNHRMTKDEHEKVMEAYDEAKSNGGFTAQNVEAMTPAEMSETLALFKEDGDNEGLDLFLNQLVWAGMIPESAYGVYYSAYSTKDK